MMHASSGTLREMNSIYNVHDGHMHQTTALATYTVSVSVLLHSLGARYVDEEHQSLTLTDDC
jgi:hypothetical protein